MKLPKYRKHSSRDKAFVEWNGRREYLPGPYNSLQSKRAYRAYLEQHVIPFVAASKVAAIDVPDDVSLSMLSLCGKYLKFAKRYYPGGTDHTEYDNMRFVARMLVAEYGKLAATSFGPKRLKEFRDILVRRDLSRSYINACVGRVKRIFRWAASEELLPSSAWRSLTSVDGLRRNRTEARETESRHAVAWKDVEPVFAELSPTVAAMLWLQFYTGARSDSIVNATPEQFESDGDLWLWRPKHKTEHLGKEVVLPIGPKCQAVLRPFMDRSSSEFMFRPVESATWNSRKRQQDRKTPTTPRDRKRQTTVNGRYGRKYSSQSYARALSRAQERAKVEHWTPHQLRHSKAQEIRDRYGVEAAQAMLGHDSLEATQLYSERRLDLAKSIARESG